MSAVSALPHRWLSTAPCVCALVGSALIMGCSKQPSESSSPTPSADAVEFSGWEEWTKINPTRFESGDHSGAFVDVYVEPEYAEVYTAVGPTPVGMRVVKAQYKAIDSKVPRRLTVMDKREPGYDAEAGDWYYGFAAPDGSVRRGGKLRMCTGCHAGAADKDYLFRLE